MEKKQRSRFFQLAIGAALAVSSFAYASTASAEPKYPVPQENRDFFMKKGPRSDEGVYYVEVGLRWMWSPNFAQVLSEKIGKPVTAYDIRRDNPEKTIALCQKPGDGFRYVSSKDPAGKFSRSSDAVWSDCPQDRRYVYLLPKETLEITGIRHVTIETRLEVANALEKCADAACVQDGLKKLGNELILASSAASAPAVAETETSSESEASPDAETDAPEDNASVDPPAVVSNEINKLENKLRDKDVELAAAVASSRKTNYLLFGLAALVGVFCLILGRYTKREKKTEKQKAVSKDTGFNPKTIAQTLLNEEYERDGDKATAQKVMLFKKLKKLGVKSKAVHQDATFRELLTAVDKPAPEAECSPFLIAALRLKYEEIGFDVPEGDIKPLDLLNDFCGKLIEKLDSIENAKGTRDVLDQLGLDDRDADGKPIPTADIVARVLHDHKEKADQDLMALHALFCSLCDPSEPAPAVLSSKKPEELVEAIGELIARKDAEYDKIRDSLVETAVELRIGLDEPDGKPVSSVALAKLIRNKCQEMDDWPTVCLDLFTWLKDSVDLRQETVDRIGELCEASGGERQEFDDVLKDLKKHCANFEAFHEQVAGFRLYESGLIEAEVKWRTRELEESHRSEVAGLESRISDLEQHPQEPTLDAAVASLTRLVCNGEVPTVSKWQTLKSLLKLVPASIKIQPESFDGSGLDADAIQRLHNNGSAKRLLREQCTFENLRFKLEAIPGLEALPMNRGNTLPPPPAKTADDGSMVKIFPPPQ